MPIEDVFSISGRGTVVTGRIERGIVKVGEEIEIVGMKVILPRPPVLVLRCSASCWIRVKLAIMLVCYCVVPSVRMLSAVRCWPSLDPSPHTKFKCEAYVLNKDEGGRHTPFFSNYRPQFYFRTTDVTGSVALPAGTEMVMPGDNIAIL